MPYGFEDWPRISLESYRIGRELNVRSFKVGQVNYDFEPRRIVITGMGGSGIVGDLLRDTFSSHEVLVFKDFKIPSWVGRDSLVLAVSYSGETLETICSALDAFNRGMPVVGIASGGRLVAELGVRGLPVVKVPKAIAPRFGLPNLLYAALGVLSSYINVGGIEGSIDAQRKALGSSIPGELASYIADSVPFIFAPASLQGIAYRFKNDLNENAKTPAIVAIVPEADHNDIVASMLKAPVKYITIRGSLNRHHEILMNIVEDVLRKYAGDLMSIRLEGDDILSKEMYGAVVLGLATIRLSEIKGIDPVRTDPISMLKDRMSGLGCPS